MNERTTKRATRNIAASIAVATALATGGAWAADNNWTGAVGDNLFKTDGNWSTGSRPASDTLYFDSNNFDANFTANEIVFDDAYVNNGSFTIQRVGTSKVLSSFAQLRRRTALHAALPLMTLILVKTTAVRIW